MNDLLITGAALTADTLTEFKTRLEHDCTGAGYAEHCTVQPVFVVKKREYIYGVDLDYAEKRAIYCNDEYYHSIAEFMEDSSESFKQSLDTLVQKGLEMNFSDLDEDVQFSTLALNEHIQVFGYIERWGYLNVHFTQLAADEFIRRSAHNYPDGLKVCQESQQYCPEFNTIHNAILTGKLALKEQS